jgi:nucleoside-diphosphate-sugar epimerase
MGYAWLIYQVPELFYSWSARFLALLHQGPFDRYLSPQPIRPTAEAVPRHGRGEASHEALVLVIGGRYIGSVLVRRLIASGRRLGFRQFVYGNAPLQALAGHPNFEFHAGDCRNIKNVVRAVDGVDTIVHLAAIVGDPACEQDRQTALETNYAATRMLIEVAKGARVSRLVFASTCSVYGASDQLMDEASPTEPISLYAQTKVHRTALLEPTESTHLIIVRLPQYSGIRIARGSTLS